MRLIEFIANGFINTFGITQPSESAKRRVSWVILAMLVLSVLVALVIGSVFYTVLHR